MKENRVVLELLLPKPGGHVLSPDFDQIKRWAVIEMGLEDIHITCFRIGPVQEFGLDCPCICILVDYVSV